MVAKRPAQDESQMIGARKFKVVRGGGICKPGDKTPTLIRGTLNVAMCTPTPGKDPRPRYRAAGKQG